MWGFFVFFLPQYQRVAKYYKNKFCELAKTTVFRITKKINSMATKPTTQKISTISRRGIHKGNVNGSWNYEHIFKDSEGARFRISIHSETYAKQSYAKLCMWTSKEGWENIITKNPSRDYRIDISNKTIVDQSAFDPIIDDLFEIWRRF